MTSHTKKPAPKRNCLRGVVRCIKRNYHEYECIACERRAEAWCMWPENAYYFQKADYHYEKAKENGSNMARI